MSASEDDESIDPEPAAGRAHFEGHGIVGREGKVLARVQYAFDVWREGRQMRLRGKMQLVPRQPPLPLDSASFRLQLEDRVQHVRVAIIAVETSLDAREIEYWIVEANEQGGKHNILLNPPV